MFLILVAVGLTLAVSPAFSSQSDEARFEVASVKPSNRDAGTSIGPAKGGDRYQARNITLKSMIQSAYRLRADHVVGGPAWLDEDRFDLDAKADRPRSEQELREMLKAELKDRFHLEVRMVKREMPVYFLNVDQSGPLLTHHDPEAVGDARVALENAGPLHVRVTGTVASMGLFTYRMGYLLDRPLIDRTGLTGGYDFVLNYTVEPTVPLPDGTSGHSGQAIDLSGPRLADALKKQLGLRMESGKAEVEIMTIIGAQKPSAN